MTNNDDGDGEDDNVSFFKTVLQYQKVGLMPQRLNLFKISLFVRRTYDKMCCENRRILYKGDKPLTVEMIMTCLSCP